MELREKKLVWIVAVLVVGIFTVLFFLYLWPKAPPKFSVTFFNVGQGDSALIKFRNGETMLIDCGPDNNILSKLGWNLNFFNRTIDYLVVSHPDGDHYGGCPAVLKRYQVKNIFINGAQKNDEYFWQPWQIALQVEGANVKIINGLQKLNIDNDRLTFFSPGDDLGVDYAKSGGNDQSIVLKIQDLEKGSFIFMGDAEVILENALLAKYCASTTPCPALKADYLKVGHHGSDSSSGDNFLQAVSPKYAIISVGKNSYGHPSLRILRKLERVDAQIWRTDEKSDIIIK